MEGVRDADSDAEVWLWSGEGSGSSTGDDRNSLARSFARSFNGIDGSSVIDHLRRTILDRRLGPTASDSELRFLEGQRSVVAHIITMIDRGSNGRK